MEILTHPIVALAIVIGVLVTIHELGHYLVGRFFNIAAESFSIGFGPTLISKKLGDTTFKISLLPLGGYVRFYGMIPSEQIPEGVSGKRFVDASYIAKASTLAAGPLANLLLAMLVYAGMVMHGIPRPQAVIGDVEIGSVADRMGLRFGDKVTAIDSRAISSWTDMREIVAKSAGKKLTFTLERDGKTLELPVYPEAVAGQDMLGRPQQIGRLGVARGAAPAAIAVVDSKSVAAQAGLRTGMKIISIRASTDLPESPVKYWGDLVHQLRTLVISGARSVVLAVTSGSENTTKEITLSTESLRCPECGPLNDKDFMLRLGVTRSLFVVKDAEELNKLNKPEQWLQPNDLLLTWQGKRLETLQQFAEIQEKNEAKSVTITVLRDFNPISLDLKLKSVELQLPAGKQEVFILPVQLLGLPVDDDNSILQLSNPFAAVWFGAKEALAQAGSIAKAIGMLFIGEVPLKALGGPIMIANAAGDAAQAGFMAFLSMLAVISLNLAIFNAIPLPLFDGGQIVLASFEAIRGRRLSEAALENFQRLGFAILMALIVIATHNDLTRYWASMIRALTGGGAQ